MGPGQCPTALWSWQPVPLPQPWTPSAHMYMHARTHPQHAAPDPQHTPLTPTLELYLHP